MQKASSSGLPVMTRAILFLLYLIAGLCIFLYGSNTIRSFPTNRNATFEWGLAFFFLAVMVLLRLVPRLQAYWKVAFALFAAAFGNALNLYLGNFLNAYFPSTYNSPQFFAIDKISQGIPIVLSIIVFTLLVGDDLGSLFLQKGNLRQGLTFGFISFAIWAAFFAFIAVLQSSGPVTTGLMASGMRLDTVLAALPWMLVFCFANSLMEELWFRGVSLGRLAPLLGTRLTIVVTATIFGVSHVAATYVNSAESIGFAAIVVSLGLINAYVMLKTRNIWGSVLFHAGYDLMTIIPLLITY
jgi:membrane protease YdiL (CAAX protease family)